MSAGVDGVRDLAGGNPDPRLLPPLRPALDAAELRRPTVDNVRSVLPGLAEAAAARFARDGVPTDALAVCSGALDAMERVLLIHTRPGDRVLVEDPGYPPVHYLLAALGLRAVPCPVDAAGVEPAAVAAGAGDARALVLTPRAQNPTGAVLSAARAGELREVLRDAPELLVVEDDHASDVAGPPGVATLAEPGRRWAVIRSVSKSLGADLRLALAATDPATGVALRGRQRRGPGWVSGLLQQAVLHQWTAPVPTAVLRAARAAYAERRAALRAALAERGIAATGDSGLNVWVPVAEEDPVVAGMRAAGYAVSAGRRFRLASPPAVRITVSALPPAEAGAVAAALAGVLDRVRDTGGDRSLSPAGERATGGRA
jgi:DNA-binding transcriptional MocR family regulator